MARAKEKVKESKCITLNRVQGGEIGTMNGMPSLGGECHPWVCWGSRLQTAKDLATMKGSHRHLLAKQQIGSTVTRPRGIWEAPKKAAKQRRNKPTLGDPIPTNKYVALSADELDEWMEETSKPGSGDDRKVSPASQDLLEGTVMSERHTRHTQVVVRPAVLPSMIAPAIVAGAQVESLLLIAAAAAAAAAAVSGHELKTVRK